MSVLGGCDIVLQIHSGPLTAVFNQTNAKGETFKSYELLLCLHYGNTMHSL